MPPIIFRPGPFTAEPPKPKAPATEPRPGDKAAKPKPPKG